MTPLIHEMILASAGSGKTYQLTHRYIALMALDWKRGLEPKPERIIALTFTRKAAGEFFESILRKLARGATSDEDAAGLCPPEGDPLHEALHGLKASDYRQLLKVFVQRMPRLFLGTLDSLFAAILRGFPAEFGLPGGFDILDEHQADAAQSQVFRQVFRHAIESGGDQGREFLESFRRVNMGREGVTVKEMLTEYVDSCHGTYLQAPEPRYWGDRATIWPEGNSIGAGLTVDYATEFTRLFEWFESCDPAPTEKCLLFWEQFREQLQVHTPGLPFTGRINYFLHLAGKHWDQIQSGEAAIKINYFPLKMDRVACECFGRIVQGICAKEIQARLEQTRGIWSMLKLYEDRYSGLVRRQGRLTFSDLEVLLSPRRQGDKALVLTQRPDEDQRLRIDYRLDARYDHWLLDEFQDTSFLQWSVIENLIDEAVQDTSEERSLFQVGDIKQAIYGWRGGDTQLFTMLRQRYRHIAQRPLDESRRSGHDVITMVNRLFGSPELLRQIELPAATLARWQWGEHVVSDHHRDLPGYAALLHPPAGETEKPTEEDVFRVVVALLDEIQPIHRGMTCAILVQSNKKGHAIVDHIRANSLTQVPVMADSEITVASSTPLNLALVDLIRHAAHPGDGFARQHLQLTPFSRVMERLGLNQSQVDSRIRKEIHEKGYEETLKTWLSELQATVVPVDDFSLRRAGDLLLAARGFDRSGNRDMDEFIAHVSDHTTREVDTRSAVQVLTVHKAKGLTFDMVILPDLGGDSLSNSRKGIAVHRGADRAIQWVLQPPGSDVVELDPVLREHHAGEKADAGYEELCKFYVALTRAKHANYLIALPRGSSSSSHNFIQLLELAYQDQPEDFFIGDLQVTEVGRSQVGTTDRLWYEKTHPLRSPASTTPDPETSPPSPPSTALARLRPRRRTPSASEIRTIPAKLLLFPGSRNARDLGNLVHGLFEQIEWADALGPEALQEAELKLSSSLTAVAEGILTEARHHLTRCLATREIKSLLERPPGPDISECWREQRFEILLGDEWLSGAFDRVVLTRDPITGTVRSAMIIDFKTDLIPPDQSDALAKSIATYRPQIQTYRQVLARMTGLAPEKIEARLIFTRLAVAAHL